MGTWSTSIYGNDISCDVRDTYINNLYKGLSDEDALLQTLNDYSDVLQDKEESPNLWFALADTMWKLGRLTPEVKDRAIECIEKYKQLNHFAETKRGEATRQKVLSSLNSTLSMQMPKRKVVKSPYPENKNPWEIGDCYAYRFHKSCSVKRGLAGKYIVIQKIANGDIYGDASSVVQVFNKVFDALPQLTDICDVVPLPLFENGYMPFSERYLCSTIFYYKRADYPEKWLYFIGNENNDFPEIIDNTPRYNYEHLLDWSTIDDALSRIYRSWNPE